MDLARIVRRLFLNDRPTAAAGNRRRLTVLHLEDKIVPRASNIFAVGTGAGIAPVVKVFNNQGALIAQFAPYAASFTGGVSVAVGDVNGDSTPDVVTGAGSGGSPHVIVFNGVDIAAGSSNPGVLAQFFAYDVGFTGGVFVAAGDINGDARADVITGAGAGGGPHVKAFSGQNVNGPLLLSFFAYAVSFTGGVTVASGDIGGDQITEEVITGAGAGGGPHVKAYDYINSTTPDELTSFFAYPSTFTGGVFVGSGRTSNNLDSQNFNYDDIITGAGAGGGPHVKVFRLLDAIDPNWSFPEAASFFAYPASFTGGVRVGAFNPSPPGTSLFDNMVTGPGPTGGPHVKTFSGASIMDFQTFSPNETSSFFAFDPAFSGGIFVG